MNPAVTIQSSARCRCLPRAAIATWIPTLSMMLVTTISYIDRNTLALLAPSILRETNLNNEQYGWIIAGFSLAYMVGNPVWGWIVDRVGLRRSMGIAVSLWTLASISHALAGGFRGFLAARTALGCGEGATYPGALRTVMQTLPVQVRMRGTGLAYCGGSIGAILTPILITPLAAAFGWRAAFWCTGAVGALWLAMWAVVSRRPELARPVVAATASKSPDGPLWANPRLWGLLGIYSLGGAPIAFVLYQSSVYLSTVFHKSQVEIGHVLWLPPLGWEVGFLFWGWSADRFPPSSPREWRWRVLILTVMSLPLAAVPLVDSYAVALALMSFAMFVCSGFVIASLAYANRVYSTSQSGLLGGLASGSWSAVVALEMPVAGRLFDQHAYGEAFLLAALLPAVGFALWRVLDR